MKNVKISILVPVYNVEQYLPRCIESVLSQDFQDWEMILVDDGSPDKCPQICDEYSQKDLRIKVLHKKNGGQVSARQAGLDAAKGEYLMFLDSDDYILPKAISTLYIKIVEDYDMVRGGYVFASAQGNIPSTPCNVERLEGGDKYREYLIYGKIDSYLWGALYRRSVFENINLDIIQRLSIGEDWCTNFLIADKFKRICFLKDIVYAYWMNDKSIMHKTLPSHKYVDRMHLPLSDFLGNSHPKISHLLEAHRIAAHVNLSFYDEIYYEDQYRKLMNGFIHSNGKHFLRPFLLHPYYLWFRNARILYYLFNRIVALAVRYKKYKGQKRNIVD